jgi:hypothetical protein
LIFMAASNPGAGAPELLSLTARMENVLVDALSPALNTCAVFQSSAPFPVAPIGWPFTQTVAWFTAVTEIVAEAAVFPAALLKVRRNATFPTVGSAVQIHEAVERPLSDRASRFPMMALCFAEGL